MYDVVCKVFIYAQVEILQEEDISIWFFYWSKHETHDRVTEIQRQAVIRNKKTSKRKRFMYGKQTKDQNQIESL